MRVTGAGTSFHATRLINSSVQRAPSGMVNTECTFTPLIVFLEDHKAETLQEVVHVIEKFVNDNPFDNFQFCWRRGNGGIEAATNEVIEKANSMMLIFVCGGYLALLYYFQKFARGALYRDSLRLTSVLCEALMAQMGIGVKVATLPVIALGVGLVWITDLHLLQAGANVAPGQAASGSLL